MRAPCASACLTGAFIVCLLSPAQVRAQRPAEAPTFLDANALDEAIRAAASGDARWRGGWLEIDPPDSTAETPGVFVVRRVFDASRIESQKAAFAEFLKRWLPQGNYQIDTKRDRDYPFSELLATLELTIETDPALAGCEVTGGYYAPDENNPEQLRLVLSGRRAKDGQDVEIEKLSGSLMRHDPRWLRANAAGQAALAATPVTSQLAQVAPSEANGRWFYADGLRHFWKGRFTEAARSFHQATLEAPRVLKYHYWWILADLQQGKRRLAKRRMAMIAGRFREEDFDHQSADYRIVLRSLERVQGPLRQELDGLERQALFGPTQLGANF